MMTIKKNQKPIDYDISFKYICENCGASHWLFLREASEENFKVVCECSETFIPQQISTINIVYHKEPDNKVSAKSLSVDKLKTCVKTLVSLGYSSSQAESMVLKSFDKIESDDCSDLIKYSLKTFGGQYV